MLSGRNYLKKTGRILLYSLLSYYFIGLAVSIGSILVMVVVNDCPPCDALVDCVCPREGTIDSLLSGSLWLYLLVSGPIIWPAIIFYPELI